MDLERLKSKIRPDMSIMVEVDKFILNLNLRLKKLSIKATSVPGGSVAKGTFLKGDFDIDLFIKFDYAYKDQDISDLLEKALYGLEYERVHGSRDYFQIKDNYTYELVPVLDITDPKKAVNVTDMSPLHVGWVKKNMSSGQEDEIRLAKLFCKAHRVYGAESYIMGFSGHVLDILIIHYGSFKELLIAASRWKDHVLVDVTGRYNSYSEAKQALNRSKTVGPMVVIDPMQPARNAAAALSNDKFELFKKICKDYLNSPTMHYFKKEKITHSKLRSIAGNNSVIILTVTPLEGKTDVVGGKLLKIHEYLLGEIKANDFELLDSGWEWDGKALMWYIHKGEQLSREKTVLGPPASKHDHADKFKSAHNKTFVKDNRIYAVQKRKFIILEDLVKTLLEKKYILERCKNISLS